MYARVTQFHILPDKLEPFLGALKAAIPHARQQQGFRALIAFRGEAGSGSTVDLRVMSIWTSIEDMQAGEQNFYFYQALAKVMAFSKGFPLIDGQEVLLADFGSDSNTPSQRNISADETKF